MNDILNEIIPIIKDLYEFFGEEEKRIEDDIDDYITYFCDFLMENPSSYDEVISNKYNISPDHLPGYKKVILLTLTSRFYIEGIYYGFDVMSEEVHEQLDDLLDILENDIIDSQNLLDFLKDEENRMVVENIVDFSDGFWQHDYLAQYRCQKELVIQGKAQQAIKLNPYELSSFLFLPDESNFSEGEFILEDALLLFNRYNNNIYETEKEGFSLLNHQRNQYEQYYQELITMFHKKYKNHNKVNQALLYLVSVTLEQVNAFIGDSSFDESDYLLLLELEDLSAQQILDKLNTNPSFRFLFLYMFHCYLGSFVLTSKDLIETRKINEKREQ